MRLLYGSGAGHVTLAAPDRPSDPGIWTSKRVAIVEEAAGVTTLPASGPQAVNDPRSSELIARVYTLRGPLIQFFSRRVRDASEVDDLVQDVFVRILRRGPLENDDRWVGYVFQTADSVWKDRNRVRRSRHRDQHVPLDVDIHADRSPNAETSLIARQALRTSTLALMDLPERTRSAFLLRRLDGMAYAEIARRLGISVSAAEKHVLKAARHVAATAREDSQ